MRWSCTGRGTPNAEYGVWGFQAVAAGRSLEAENLRRLVELLRLQPRPPTVPEELEHLVVRYSRCRRGLLWKINQLLQHVERGSPNAICCVWGTPNLVEGQ